MTFDEIYAQVQDLAGWMPAKDCEMLHEYVSRIENGLIVEIGAFMGISTKVMALSSPTSRIVSIDPFLKVHSSAGIKDDDPEYVMKRLLEVMDGENFELIHDKSENVGKTWSSPIDFLHIDGSHWVKDLNKDIELFVPHVKKGCYVFFHDYNIGPGYGEDSGEFVRKTVDGIVDKYFDERIFDTQLYGFAICRKK